MRASLIAVALALSIGIAYWVFKDGGEESLACESEKTVQKSNLEAQQSPSNAEETPTSKLEPTRKQIERVVSDLPPYPHFQRYALEDGSIEKDLKLTRQSVQDFWILFKDPDLIRLESNASIVAALTGDNPEGIQFIPAQHSSINDAGELLDRWGTPLIFHALAVNHIEIRSAGEDGKPYSDDDSVVVAKGMLR